MNTRKKSLGLAAACCAALAASIAGAVELSTPRPGDMTRYDLPGYTLVMIDNAQLRRDISKLPRLRRALELSLGIEVKSTGIPTFVYFVSGSIWDKYLEPSNVMPSEFMATRFANYIVGDSGRISRTGLFHEHTHLYLYSQMPGVYPLWFDEGLATFMASGQFSDSSVRFTPRNNTGEFAWLPTARLIRVTRSDPEYFNQKQIASFHYQSRAMMYRALVDDPEFGKRVFKYLEALNNLEPIDVAEKNLDDNIEALDFRMQNYLNESGKKKVTLELEGVAELELPAGTPVPKLDALLGIARVCLDTGVGLEHAHELLDAADQEPGGAARSAPLRMRLAARRQDNATLEKLYAALKDSKDPAAAGSAGLALFDRARSLEASPQRTDLLSRGFDLMNRSLAAKADDPETVWAFAMTAAELDRNNDVALQRLVPMFERLPGNADLAQAAAMLLHKRGGQNVMPYLTAVLRDAHSLEQKRWALERINALRAGAAPAAATQ